MEAGILGGLKLMSIPSSEIRELFCFTSTSSLAAGSWNLTFFLDFDFFEDLDGVVAAAGDEGKSTSLIEDLVILLEISDSADTVTAIVPKQRNVNET